jgi:AtzE family amidohydrolase
MTAVEIAAAVRAGRISAIALTQAALARIEARNPALNAFTEILRDRALREAGAVDRAVAAGRDPGPLAGVPYGVKNLYDVAGLPTRAGSLINRDRPAATHDAVLVQRLLQAGAVLLGTQNMDEYAYGFTTENAHDGTTRNPHDEARVAGGSSGGSAAAVAADLCSFSLGSDTNGSIRVPASFCGIFGLKPTYGRLPRSFTFPFVFDLDHLGPFARTATDLALVYDALQGPDPADPACANRTIEPTSPHLSSPPAGLRIGVLHGWFRDMAQPEACAALDEAAAGLGPVSAVILPGAEQARAAAFLITASQGANLHFASLRDRAEDFDPATRDRLLAGALLPAQAVQQAQRVRRWFAEQVAEVFTRFDILLAPSTPCPATLTGQQTITLRGQDFPARSSLGVLTQPLSCIGLPIAAVPLRRRGALPIGIQVIAPPWQEVRALQVAAWLERLGLAGARIAA